MNRRQFIRAAGTTVAVAVTTQSVDGLAYSDDAVAQRSYPINRGWLFYPSAVSGFHDPAFSDEHFTGVVLPHTNVMLPWNGFDDRQFEFISAYRRRLNLPPNSEGKRLFIDFEGVMTASKVWLNGSLLGEYKGGYTPFSFEITSFVRFKSDNILAVEVDSTERNDIPPFGNQIDYMTFGGIYREVWLRVVPQVFIENMHVITKNVLGQSPSIDVNVYLDRASLTGQGALSLNAELRDGDRTIARSTAKHGMPAVTRHNAADSDQGLGAKSYDPLTDAPSAVVSLTGFGGKVDLWDLSNPKLYTVHLEVMENGKVIDSDTRRVGFREAIFTEKGFSLNGKVIKLRGLDRHQTFPWVGQAMSGRAQRQDAKILRHDLHCNIVRTSHYPQSRHFLDACDEIGLLVLEEIPGWQHIGDTAWQDISVDNVRRMIRRDWNHPSIILWGVRINESRDNHDFYTRTNNLARALDSTRQTGGIRNRYDSEFLEDVFTMNDFGFPLRKPNHPAYLNTEFVGHTFPTKIQDGAERTREHTLRHARIHDQLASDPQYAGGIGWCAFDYNTHSDFGSGDRLCYHGVSTIFREPKFAGMFYKSQCDTSEAIVLEPAFAWAEGDESTNFTDAVVCSNCEQVRFFVSGKQVAECGPDRKAFPNLAHPPFIANLSNFRRPWGDLKIEGYINGKKVIEKNLSGDGVVAAFGLFPDDTEIVADGADATRVVLRATDRYGNRMPFSSVALSLSIDGPGVIIGDNPFPLVGGSGAVWIRSTEQGGEIVLRASHPHLGSKSISLSSKQTAKEIV